jgi:hypothetical protein
LIFLVDNDTLSNYTFFNSDISDLESRSFIPNIRPIKTTVIDKPSLVALRHQLCPNFLTMYTEDETKVKVNPLIQNINYALIYPKNVYLMVFIVTLEYFLNKIPIV